MAQVIWTEPTLDNIEEIAEYIALSTPAAAGNFVQRIFTATDRLMLFQESGRIPVEITEFSYREVVVNHCRVFYKIQEEAIYILYVLRQERDVRSYIVASQQAN
jgi:plasmid stabilization system protein ParE